MKLHYMGKYNNDPETLPHSEHMPGAVKFKEAENSKQLALIANILSIVIMILLAVPAVLRCKAYFADNFLKSYWQMLAGCICSFLTLFPHELLHGICFKNDVYLYTNLSQGMMFVVGPENMSKRRFVFMSLLPNIVFGFVPYIVGMVFPNMIFLLILGTMCIGMGAGDYYNVFNAARQMPKGARTYLYKFNSYWYMP